MATKNEKQIIDTTSLSQEAIDILHANDTIRTMDIKGKDYAEVNQRVKAFRLVHPLGSIETSIVSINNGTIVMKACIYTKDKDLLATGYAYEKEDSSLVNKTSFIENCETSAVGRALGMCGYGIDTALASFEEVKSAIDKQEKLVKDEKKKVEALKPTTSNAQDKQINKFNEIYKLVEKGKLLSMKSVNEMLVGIRGTHCNIADLTDEEFNDLYAQVKARVDEIKSQNAKRDLAGAKEKETKQPETDDFDVPFSYNDVDFSTEDLDEMKEELF